MSFHAILHALYTSHKNNVMDVFMDKCKTSCIKICNVHENNIPRNQPYNIPTWCHGSIGYECITKLKCIQCDLKHLNCYKKTQFLPYPNSIPISSHRKTYACGGALLIGCPTMSVCDREEIGLGHPPKI